MTGTLGGAIANALGILRSEADSMQTVQVRIVRNGTLAASAPDPGTGVVTPAQTTVYDGSARVRPLSRATAGDVTAGEARSSDAGYQVSLPSGTTGVQAGDIVNALAALDPDVITDAYRVEQVLDGDDLTARRLLCKLIERRQA